MSLAAVAGGTGLLGREVIHELLTAGWTVRASWFHTPPARAPSVQWIQADLRKPEEASRLLSGATRAFLCAGITSGSTAVDRVSPYARGLALAATLIEAAVSEGVERIGVISSSTVYPHSVDLLCEENGHKGDPAYTALGWMNRAIERLARYVHDERSAVVAIVRPANFYGPSMRMIGPGLTVLPDLIRRAIAGEKPFRLLNGDWVRDFVHVADVAAGLIRAVEVADGEPVNLGSGTSVTVEAAARLVLNLLGVEEPLQFVVDQSPTEAPRVRVLDIRRARTVLGYAPRWSLEDGLRDTLEKCRARVG